MNDQRLRILVCEDNPLMVKGLQFTLEQYADIEVVGYARDGLKAVSKAQELKPDLILMDLGMPNLNGVEAIKRIREEDTSVRILVLSASEDESMIDDALRNGACGTFKKPVLDPEDLYHAIRQAMAKGSG